MYIDVLLEQDDRRFLHSLFASEPLEGVVGREAHTSSLRLLPWGMQVPSACRLFCHGLESLCSLNFLQ